MEDESGERVEEDFLPSFPPFFLLKYYFCADFRKITLIPCYYVYWISSKKVKCAILLLEFRRVAHLPS